jgi:hypothetical protein
MLSFFSVLLAHYFIDFYEIYKMHLNEITGMHCTLDKLPDMWNYSLM